MNIKELLTLKRFSFGHLLLLFSFALAPVFLFSNSAELSAAWAFIYLSVAMVESVLPLHKRK